MANTLFDSIKFYLVVFKLPEGVPVRHIIGDTFNYLNWREREIMCIF